MQTNSREQSGAQLRLKLLVPAIGAILAVGVGSAKAASNETLVCNTTQENIEFDHDDGIGQFVDIKNRLWTFSVDTTTGNFIPSTGYGTQVDSYVDYAGTYGNGPEFVKSTSGYSLVYNKFLPPASTNGTNPAATYIQRADLVGSTWKLSNDVNSIWSTSTLGYVEPEGNLNPTQSDPPIVFHNGTDPNSPLYIMGIHDFQPVAVPNTNSNDTLGSARFVPGLNELIYTATVTVNGVAARQIFSYDVGTGVTTQLTFDSTNKGDVFMFQAPEYNNAYILMSSINRQYLNFYQYKYNSTTHTSSWQVVTSLHPAQGAGAPPFLFSPEAFFYKNKTYIYMVRSSSANSTTLAVPTEIWVASLDGTKYSRVSNAATSSPSIVRSDPKYYITSSGIYIYFIEYLTPTSSSPIATAHGTWKANSGIPL